MSTHGWLITPPRGIFRVALQWPQVKAVGSKNKNLTHCRQVTRQHRSGRHAQRATLRVTSKASGSSVRLPQAVPTASQSLRWQPQPPSPWRGLKHVQMTMIVQVWRILVPLLSQRCIKCRWKWSLLRENTSFCVQNRCEARAEEGAKDLQGAKRCILLPARRSQKHQCLKLFYVDVLTADGTEARELIVTVDERLLV